jgi:hypothetical protein
VKRGTFPVVLFLRHVAAGITLVQLFERRPLVDAGSTYSRVAAAAGSADPDE